MSKPAPWLLLPVETKAREFHAKLLLGAMAVERGHGVVLGEQNAMVRQIAHLPRGLYLDKSIAATKTGHFQRLRRHGFKIAAWCEEGLVYRDRAAYLQQRICPASLAEIDRFFCWGEVQRRDVAGKVAGDANKLVATGNPRFDLLRPAYRDIFAAEAGALRARHGDFILINTNFSRYNHFHGVNNMLQAQTERGNIQTPEQEAFLIAWRDFLGELFHAFAAMLAPLSRAFPNHQIILRPHPSEDHQRWRRECAGLDNVSVAFSGNVVPWLLAARVLIHNSCTTGLEAHLMDRPVITYQPVRSDIYDSDLPNAVSHQVRAMPSLLRAVTAALAGENLDGGPDGRGTAARYYAAIDGRAAGERVLDAIGELDLPPPQTPGSSHGLSYHQGQNLGHRLGRLSGHVTLPVRDMARRILNPAKAAYNRQKFPGLTLGEMRREMARMQAASGRFGGVRITPLGHLCFALMAAT